MHIGASVVSRKVDASPQSWFLVTSTGMAVALAALILTITPESAAPARALCRTTAPNGKAPPGEERAPSWYGAGGLFIDMPRGGEILAPPASLSADGAISEKIGWFARRATGTLRIRGRRLYHVARPLKARINAGWPDDGFRGSAFWSSSLRFSAPGCWRVTASVARARLTFTVNVGRARWHE
jgi:hypothetical protein